MASRLTKIHFADAMPNIDIIAAADRNGFNLFIADQLDNLTRVVVFSDDVVFGAAVFVGAVGVVESMRICDLE